MDYNITELRSKLKIAKKGNPDAYQIIGAVSGLGKKRVKEIADGKDEPTIIEFAQLEALS